MQQAPKPLPQQMMVIISLMQPDTQTHLNKHIGVEYNIYYIWQNLAHGEIWNNEIAKVMSMLRNASVFRSSIQILLCLMHEFN